MSQLQIQFPDILQPESNQREVILANLDRLVNYATKSIQTIQNANQLHLIKSKVLGKESWLNDILSRIKIFPPEDKVYLGKIINSTKSQLLQIINEAQNKCLDNTKILGQTKQKPLLISRAKTIGSAHPVSKISKDIINFLSFYGFIEAKAPDIDNDWNNFESLNIPKNHPARQMHDTFYMPSMEVLRTHTSNAQVRFMQQNKPPLRFYSYGRTYRKDSDRTHTPMFHQMEIVMVDTNVSLANLKWFINALIQHIFEQEVPIRLRPSYFPFTQPSIEVDIMLGGKWLEVLGSGMIHNTVLKNAGVDPTIYSGFALGMGLDRLAMIKYNITDLRQMFDCDYNNIRKYSHYTN